MHTDEASWFTSTAEEFAAECNAYQTSEFGNLQRHCLSHMEKGGHLIVSFGPRRDTLTGAFLNAIEVAISIAVLDRPITQEFIDGLAHLFHLGEFRHTVDASEARQFWSINGVRASTLHEYVVTHH